MRIPKTIAIVLGLVLGWWAAGFVQTTITAAQDPHGPAETHESHDAAPDETPHGEQVHGEGGHGDGHGGAARALVPEENPPYFAAMTTIIIVLFVLAAVVGSAALLIKGPEPPDLADEHDH